jgi:hypothetical protein
VSLVFDRRLLTRLSLSAITAILLLFFSQDGIRPGLNRRTASLEDQCEIFLRKHRRPEEIPGFDSFRQAILGGETGYFSPTATEKSLEILQKVPLFTEYLNKTNQTASVDRIDDYLLWAIEQYSREKVAKLRNQSLLQQLIVRGASLGGLPNARTELEKLSADNLKRILGQGFESEIFPPEVLKVARNLIIRFRHNTVIPNANGELPLFSASAMKEIGDFNGFNTKPFNRDFLKTDDQVFFYVDVFASKSQAAKANIAASEYGAYTKYVNDDEYARSQGWISYYIMREGDLRDYGRYLPTEFKREKITNEELRSRLHLLDFTVRDFENLVQTQAARSLTALFNKSAVDFEQLAKELENINTPLGARIDQLVFAPLNLPNRWEFKVPILVEGTKISDEVPH